MECRESTKNHMFLVNESAVVTITEKNTALYDLLLVFDAFQC